MTLGLVASASVTSHAIQSTTITAPFDETFIRRGCSQNALSLIAVCGATGSASKDGSIGAGSDLSGIFVSASSPSARSESFVRVNYPVGSGVFALIVTATVHVIFASTTQVGDPAVSGASTFAELAMLAQHSSCQCVFGNDLRNVVGVGVTEVSDTNYQLRARLENFDGPATLIPPGIVTIEVESMSYAYGGTGRGSATASIDATLVSVKVDAVIY